MAMIEHPTLDMERQLAAQGCDVVIGCDEVGRGALAGPVMVGAAAMWSRDSPPRKCRPVSPIPNC